ncbi:hypothetical protein ACOSQ2_009307 [Xanthoceras sorbifolium]
MIVPRNQLTSPRYLTSKVLRDQDDLEFVDQPAEIDISIELRDQQGATRSGSVRGRRSDTKYQREQTASRSTNKSRVSHKHETSRSRRSRRHGSATRNQCEQRATRSGNKCRKAMRSSNARDHGSATRDRCEQSATVSGKEPECYDEVGQESDVSH